MLKYAGFFFSRVHWSWTWGLSVFDTLLSIYNKIRCLKHHDCRCLLIMSLKYVIDKFPCTENFKKSSCVVKYFVTKDNDWRRISSIIPKKTVLNYRTKNTGPPPSTLFSFPFEEPLLLSPLILLLPHVSLPRLLRLLFYVQMIKYSTKFIKHTGHFNMGCINRVTCYILMTLLKRTVVIPSLVES